MLNFLGRFCSRMKQEKFLRHTYPEVKAILSLMQCCDTSTAQERNENFLNDMFPDDHSGHEEDLRESLDTWWDDFIYSEIDNDNTASATASTSSSHNATESATVYANTSDTPSVPPTSKICFHSEDTFLPIASILSTFTLRASDIITDSLYITNTYALFNLLFQLHHDISTTYYAHDNKNRINRPLPKGWTDPPVVRTTSCTIQFNVPNTPMPDNNDSASSQVNVLDVRSTPSTYNTSLCFLFILSAGPSGSPALPTGTLIDPWKGINKLEPPEEQEFPLPTYHRPVLNLFENTYDFHIREYKDLIDT